VFCRIGARPHPESRPKCEPEAKKKKKQQIVGAVEASVPAADEASEAVREQALASIQELQAKGACTDDLSCRICEPPKSFTAYTTLLSHLRSHAQIRSVLRRIHFRILEQGIRVDEIFFSQTNVKFYLNGGLFGVRQVEER
jgi:hypothetical protein